jgi:hypothetical protein
MNARDTGEEAAQAQPSQTAPLGPPGWASFARARDAFLRTLAIQGLERAWSGPSYEPTEEVRR